MQLNTLAPVPGSTHSKKRVGRGIGSGLGKTCGRGHKGQKARTGGKVRPGFEGGQMPLQKRVPKYGFFSRIASSTAQVRTAELNLVEGDVVNMETLEKANVIDRNTKRVKIMLSGEVSKKVTVEGVRVTKGAKAAIEAAGGTVVEAAPVEKPPSKKKKNTGKQTAAARKKIAEAAGKEEKAAGAAKESKAKSK